jgi:hypothetical protein
MKSFRIKAKGYGFYGYSKMRKSVLFPLIVQFERSGVIPKTVRPKKKAGENCDDPIECYSKKCVKDVCKTSKSEKNKKAKVGPSSEPLPGKAPKTKGKLVVKAAKNKVKKVKPLVSSSDAIQVLVSKAKNYKVTNPVLPNKKLAYCITKAVDICKVATR